MLSFRGTLVLAAALALVPGWALANRSTITHTPRQRSSAGSNFRPHASRKLNRRSSVDWRCCIRSLTPSPRGSSRKFRRRIQIAGLAQWGVAMTYFHTIWGPPTEDEFAAGRWRRRGVGPGRAGAPVSADYIAAIGAYYEGGGGARIRRRVVAYQKAMAGVAGATPTTTIADLPCPVDSRLAYNLARQDLRAAEGAAKDPQWLAGCGAEHPGIAHT